VDKIWLLARITFKDGIRHKALYGIAFLGFLLFAANILVTGMFSWELGKVAVDVGLSVVSLSGLLIIFFLSINTVSNDLESRTIYMILARPVSRAQYVVGKYLGLALVILASSAILGACAAGSVKFATFRAPGYIPIDFSWGTFSLALCFLTISLLVLAAVAFFWVSVTTHPFTAVLLSLFSYFIGQNVEAVKTMMLATGVLGENPLVLRAVDYGAWLFPNLAAFDLKTTAAYGLPIDAAYLVWLAVYGISYIGLVLFLTVLVFRRRELG